MNQKTLDDLFKQIYGPQINQMFVNPSTYKALSELLKIDIKAAMVRKIKEEFSKDLEEICNED